MDEARINRIVEWSAGVFFILAVAGLPAALISRSVGHAWPDALQITGLVVLGFVAISVLLQFVARISPVQRFLVREIDPNSKFMRVIVRLAAVQVGDPMTGSLVRKHEHDVGRLEEKDTP